MLAKNRVGANLGTGRFLLSSELSNKGYTLLTFLSCGSQNSRILSQENGERPVCSQVSLQDASLFIIIIIREVAMSGLLVGSWTNFHGLRA